MNKFKKGDEVICIKTHNARYHNLEIIKDNIYTVYETQQGLYVSYLNIDNGQGIFIDDLYNWDFKLIENVIDKTKFNELDWIKWFSTERE